MTASFMRCSFVAVGY